MKAIILAAGEGRRMRPLTLNKPKPLLRVRGKTILEHIFEALPKEIDEVIVVVKYLGKQIEDFLDDKFTDKKKTFVLGSDLGSAYSLLAAKPFIGASGRFVVIHGDDLPSKNEITECLKHESSILVCESCEPQNCGIIQLKSDGSLEKICEKTPEPKSNKVLSGVMVFRQEIFNCQPLSEQGGEYFLTSLINQYAKSFPVYPVYTGACRQFSSPGDLKTVEEVLNQRL
ncbi:nucleotidyltransferase family protein [Patescibacteria group bacterium]|nr:nucleotidyltransferase family protein [Patescibacteria group bacterium]